MSIPMPIYLNNSSNTPSIECTSGVPSLISGHIEILVGRDPNNRICMVVVFGPSNSGQIRHASSRYRVIEILAGGSSALVEWRLELGELIR
ncbi:hypothetical protein HHK36_008733 [Tetracentron sinense]|uniref:Uncharacterized protein n=1 Tax=Tetracentron sinense TaxID=13715 RepID=A0A834ZK28_TETSI|nr:hypothetical protein HHK36_008733 [Tetracentron sinense]